MNRMLSAGYLKASDKVCSMKRIINAFDCIRLDLKLSSADLLTLKYIMLYRT